MKIWHIHFFHCFHIFPALKMTNCHRWKYHSLKTNNYYENPYDFPMTYDHQRNNVTYLQCYQLLLDWGQNELRKETIDWLTQIMINFVKFVVINFWKIPPNKKKSSKNVYFTNSWKHCIYGIATCMYLAIFCRFMEKWACCQMTKVKLKNSLQL